MKKLNLLILFIAAITIISCKKDDDASGEENTTSNSQLVGTWKIVSIVEDEIPEDLSDCRKKSNYVFKSDNTYVNEHFVDGGLGTAPCLDDGFSGTYSISGNKITFIEDDSEAEGEGIVYEFKVENNVFSLIDNEGGSIYVETYTKQ